jgi:ligand-binding sensor domain-containing protein
VEDLEGNLWIGTIWGINRFNPYTETFTCYLKDTAGEGEISSNRVRSLYVDRNGKVLLGTGLSGELIEYNAKDDSFTSHQVIQLDSNEWGSVLSIYEDNERWLWLGSKHGVFKFNRNNRELITIQPPTSIPADILYDCDKILGDQQGNFTVNENV